MKRKSFAIIAAMLVSIAIHAQTDAPLVSYPTTTTTTTSSPTVSPMPVPTASTIDMAGRFGAGVTFGEPIGGTVKYFFTDTMAVDGAIGWSSADHTDLYLDADVLWHCYDLIKVSRGALPIYIGVGPLIRIKSDGFENESGIRVPIGASYFFENVPIEIFAEIGPALDISPSVRGEITGGVGIRYWF